MFNFGAPATSTFSGGGLYGATATGSNSNPTSNNRQQTTFNQYKNPATVTTSYSQNTQQQQQQEVGSAFNTHPFQYIQECFQPSSPNYRFRFFFYNLVTLPTGTAAGNNGGNITNNINKPAFVTPSHWRQVLDDNPDPSKMIPVQAEGFSDLIERRDWQLAIQQAQKEKLQELGQRCARVGNAQDLDVATQLQVIYKQQLKLTLRILKLMQICANAANKDPLNGREQTLFSRLQKILDKLSLLNVDHLEGKMKLLESSDRLGGGRPSEKILAFGGISEMSEYLRGEQEAIKKISCALLEDQRDISIIKNGLEERLENH